MDRLTSEAGEPTLELGDENEQLDRNVRPESDADALGSAATLCTST
jgi:hypothetical protein